MEDAMSQKMKLCGRRTQTDQLKGREKHLCVDEKAKEGILSWFMETQVAEILQNGSYPAWFQGFISRQEAEEQLRDQKVGCFLIRLSEKTIGYILSYKGKDRCRHFVINQTNTGLFVVSGDFTTHNSLTSLIDHFKTSPIQPFGEFLTCHKDVKDETKAPCEMFQCNRTAEAAVSVKALRSFWEQSNEILQEIPHVLLTTGRKLTASSSVDKSSLSQHEVKNIPHVPMKNLPLRNSLSVGFVSAHPSIEEHGMSDPSGWRNVVEEVSGRRRSDPWNTENHPSRLRIPKDACSSSPSIQPHFETGNTFMINQHENTQEQSSKSRSINPVCAPQLLFEPHQTRFCSYAALDFKNIHAGASRQTNQVAMEPNPLYQDSSDENNTLVKNPQQVVYAQCDINTYEPIHDEDVYEDVPAAESNMYASLDEKQPQAKNVWGKKARKWWKFRTEK